VAKTMNLSVHFLSEAYIPPLPPPHIYVHLYGPPLFTVNRDGPGGGGGTGKPRMSDGRGNKGSLRSRGRAGGGSIRCTKASSSSILSADLKSETKK
jgi:hypothetical protein